MIETALLCDQIENQLRDDILTGRLLPGQRISIEELTVRWGVSSTPVRDAIHSLNDIGFVTISPRRGIHVANLNGQMFKDVYDLRIALECLAVETAIGRVCADDILRVRAAYLAGADLFARTGDRSLLIQHDDLLHDLIVHNCTNEKLVDIMHNLRDLIAWARTQLVTRHPSSYELAVPEHLEILDALQAHDSVATQSRLRSHLKNAWQRHELRNGQETNLP